MTDYATTGSAVGYACPTCGAWVRLSDRAHVCYDGSPSQPPANYWLPRIQTLEALVDDLKRRVAELEAEGGER